MDNLINETNGRIQEIIDNLSTIKAEYTRKLEAKEKVIDEELAKVEQYKKDFFSSKEKIEKMNNDIEGFEEDYQKLVERFKDDELANILIAANKEISSKIEERKRKIAKDTVAMNELVEKAEDIKKKLVKLTAEKKALKLCLEKIEDSHEFYSKALSQVIEYANDHEDYLSGCFHDNENKKASLNSEDTLEIQTNELEEEMSQILLEPKELETSNKKTNNKQDKKSKKKEKKIEPKVEETAEDTIEIDEETEDIVAASEYENMASPFDFDEDFGFDSINFDDSLEDDNSLYDEKEDK